jgi:hypothetical protein
MSCVCVFWWKREGIVGEGVSENIGSWVKYIERIDMYNLIQYIAELKDRGKKEVTTLWSVW